MSNQIVKSLNPFPADILASRNWTVEPLGKVDYLIVSVEGLFSSERGCPDTAWLVAVRIFTKVPYLRQLYYTEGLDQDRFYLESVWKYGR